MSEDVTFWAKNTVVGFIYTISGIFFIFCIYGIYNLSWLENLKNYFPYIFILAVVFCSIIGYSSQIILQYIIVLFKPKFKYDPKIEKATIENLQDERLYKKYQFLYIVLVLFRHLIIGTFLLGVSIFLWLFLSGSYELMWAVNVVFPILFITFIITYRLHRKTFIVFRDCYFKT